MQPYDGDIPEYRSYNARGQMTRLKYTGVYNPAGTLPSVDLAYSYSSTNNDGRIAQMTNGVSGEVVNYQYDSLGRLTLAQTVGTQWGQSFGYDGFGNLTSEVATQGTAFTSYQNYDATTNRISGAGTSYDANGNLTAMPTLTLSYDEENRLVQSVQSLNGSEQYVYNPSGQLVYREAPTEWQGPAAELYIYGPQGQRIRFGLVSPSWSEGNRLLFTYDDQELYFAGKLLEPDDRLGTNVAAVSPNGAAGATFPYGELREAPYAGDRFATYLLDTTSNLNYARNRWYSSQVARFTTVDPSGSANARMPQSWNHYAYAGGDPINRRDPSGLHSYWDWFNRTCNNDPATCLVDNPPTGCEIWGFTLADPEGGNPNGSVDCLLHFVGGGNPTQTWWYPAFSKMAISAAEQAALWVKDKENYSEPCQKDLAAVGTSVEALRNAASNVQFFDGTTATDVNQRSLYNGDAAQAGRNAPYQSIADEFQENPAITAQADLYGNRVFIRPDYFNWIGNGFAPAVVMHELLHNVTGKTDDQLQTALGLSTQQSSSNITTKLLIDCVMR